MDFVAFRGKCCSITVIAGLLGCKPLLVIPQCITGPVIWLPGQHVAYLCHAKMCRFKVICCNDATLKVNSRIIESLKLNYKTSRPTKLTNVVLYS